MRATVNAIVALASLLSAAAAIAAGQVPPLSPPTAQTAADLFVSQRNGLISVRATRIDLARLASELTRVSGTEIEILDKDETREPVTLSFQDKTINEAVAEIMAALPPGGVVSAADAGGPKPTIYVLTKQGADDLRSDLLAMLASVKSETPPAPAAVRGWLLHMATICFKIDPSGTSTAIMPVLRLLDRQYALYEPMVASFFRDPSVPGPLRSAMLQVIERHWNFPTSRGHLVTIFHQVTDDRILHAQIARALSNHGENVIDELMASYQSDPPEAKAYYADALGTAGRTDAIPFLREDALHGQDSHLRCASVQAVIKLDAASAETGELVDKVIHAARPVEPSQRSLSDLENERVAMVAVVAIGQSTDPAARRKLLSIASDRSTAIDVRLTALESMTPSNAITATAKTALHDEMVSFERQLTDSTDLSDVSRERMLARVRKLLTLTASE